MKIEDPIKCIFIILLNLFLSLSPLQNCRADIEPTKPSLFSDFEALEKDLGENNPLIVHMIFFPWDSNQNFLTDELEFDHTPYFDMVKKVESIPNAKVMMWTLSKMEEFCSRYYPKIWDMLNSSKERPIIFVDVLRWLVVYHFGGIYWQYESLSLAPSMECYLPTENSQKKIKLFTEVVINQAFSKKMALQPIRKGKPEELIRVVTGAFSSIEKKNSALLEIVEFLLERLQRERALCDYDILYITGNAAISEYYDLYGQYNPEIELVSQEQTNQLIRWNSKGSWRTDKKKEKKTSNKPKSKRL